METINIKEQVKKITKDDRYSMRSAQNAYAHAKAFNELNKKIDAEAKQEELEAFDYPIADEWKVKNRKRGGIEGDFIKDYKIDYLIADSFTDEFYHAVFHRRVAKGWPVPETYKPEPYYHVTAECDSFKLLKQAEELLIDCVLATVPESMRKDLEGAREYPHREKLINIAMRWDTNN